MEVCPTLSSLQIHSLIVISFTLISSSHWFFRHYPLVNQHLASVLFTAQRHSLKVSDEVVFFIIRWRLGRIIYRATVVGPRSNASEKCSDSDDDECEQVPSFQSAFTDALMFADLNLNVDHGKLWPLA